MVEARFARGCRCFAVWIDGAVGGFGWLSGGPEWIGEIQREIRPRPGEGYLWNCLTVPEHRRKGVFRSLLIGISSIARAEGLRRLWIGTIAVPAEKVLPQSGFKPALYLLTMEVGPLYVMRAFSGDASLASNAYTVLSMHSATSIRRSRHRRH